MSAASRSVPAVPANVTEFPSFDPVSAPEGWFAQPKRIFGLAKGRLMGEAQLWLVLFLERELWGSRKRAKRDKPELLPPPEWTETLSLAKVARACGVSVQAIQPVIADAIERTLIAREKPRGSREYRYRLCPENWENCPKYVAKPQPIDATVDEDNSEGEDEAKQDASALSLSRPVVVSAGGRSKPLELPEPVEIRGFQYRSSLTSEVGIAVKFRKGLVEVDISPGEEVPAQIVEIRQPVRTADPPKEHREPVGAHVAGTARVFELQELLDPLFLRLWGVQCEPEMLANVAKILADTPLDWFSKVLRGRMKRKFDKGHLPLIAADARNGWLAAQVQGASVPAHVGLETPEPYLSKGDQATVEALRRIHAREERKRGQS